MHSGDNKLIYNFLAITNPKLQITNNSLQRLMIKTVSNKTWRKKLAPGVCA